MNSRSLTRLLVTVVLLGGAALARAQLPPRSRSLQLRQPANYFPLAVGNSWTYTIEGRAASGTVTVRVTESVETAGRQYFRLEGFTPQPALVRVGSRDRLWEFRPDSGTEHLWYDFGAAEGVDSPGCPARVCGNPNYINYFSNLYKLLRIGLYISFNDTNLRYS